MKYRTLVFSLILVGMTLPAVGQTETVGETSPTDSLSALWQQVTEMKEKLVRDSMQRAWDERQKALWKPSKPLMLGYDIWSLETPLETKYDSQIGAGISFRRTFYLHRKAIGGMMKFGLDVNWADLAFARYEKGKGIKGLWDDINDGNWDDDDNWNLDNLNLGKYQITVGMLGIGPSIHLSPLFPIGEPKLDQIKLKFYFHYVPSYTVMLLSGEEEGLDVYGGYIGRWRFGVGFGYRRWGIGWEHCWGKGKLKYLSGGDDEEEENDSFGGSSKHKISSNRFYLVFRF